MFRSTLINGAGIAASILACILGSIATAPLQHSKKLAPALKPIGKAYSPKSQKDAFNKYRHERDLKAEIRAKRARGEKLESEFPSSMMRCVCGIRFDSHKLNESYDHRAHIYAAAIQSGLGNWRPSWQQC